MSLTVYNTQTRKKEPFTPIDANHVKMYVCGPTVYNYIHIGNARPAVVFDVLFRVLKTCYNHVSYARNITDIDDKIIKAAAENGQSITELTDIYTQAYEQDMQSLQTLTPTISPKATDHIAQMISMVESLIENGHAYCSEGHVLFDVNSMEDYGKLSNRKLEDMLDGARVEVASYKRAAGDFVLWKPSNDKDPGWDSPWGRGRPGWHLECSAMIETHLGNTIDIHGGGRDLIFPHHENELAQSECAHNKEQYVKYWMHNGYLNINGEKMSKSLGNFFTVRDLLEIYHGETIRFALLSAQYRSELDFSDQLLTQSKAGLDTLYGALKKAHDVVAANTDIKTTTAYNDLLDDLNTPKVIAAMHGLAKTIHVESGNNNLEVVATAKAELLALGELLGVLQLEADTWFKHATPQDDNGLSEDEINTLIAQRIDAKNNKDYATADSIRKKLTEKGIILEDSPTGTTWKRQ